MLARLSRQHCVGTWLSLVEHSLGVRGVGSSNLPVPTININYLQLQIHPHSVSRKSRDLQLSSVTEEPTDLTPTG